jgi:hypothetical protein
MRRFAGESTRQVPADCCGATIPEITHHKPAPIDSELALGLSPVTAFTVESPTPIPTMFKINWTTRPMTAPANTAPQDISFSMMVRTSSVAEIALTCGAGDKEYVLMNCATSHRDRFRTKEAAKDPRKNRAARPTTRLAAFGSYMSTARQI